MINETKEKMGQMKLRGMLKAFEEQLSCQNMAGLSFVERLGFLIDREFLERENQKLTARLRQAKLISKYR
jgi:DNA polymerase I-like protein with 3'-5' exonuclease and polymerase domains